jgi:Ca2+-binding RTX toxin-like protein
LGGEGNDTITAISAAGETLFGLGGNDRLNGNAGTQILEGGAGDDVLYDPSGRGLYNGGAGNDTLTGGTAAEVFLGGTGNDTLTTGGGNDVILFNKGDGQDVLAAGSSGKGTLSLGGGASYDDLSLSKVSNDLVLQVGETDQITFKNWYAASASRPVASLQVIAEAMEGFSLGGDDPLRDQKVETFDFSGLVAAFDAARSANPGISAWALSEALSDFHLGGSDGAAIGGDLAYQYGKNGTLAGMGVESAFATLNDSTLGASAQSLSAAASLQTGVFRLS